MCGVSVLFIVVPVRRSPLHATRNVVAVFVSLSSFGISVSIARVFFRFGDLESERLQCQCQLDNWWGQEVEKWTNLIFYLCYGGRVDSVMISA